MFAFEMFYMFDLSSMPQMNKLFSSRYNKISLNYTPKQKCHCYIPETESQSSNSQANIVTKQFSQNMARAKQGISDEDIFEDVVLAEER